MNKIALGIMEALRECPVIDTHEHLENEDKQPKWNVLGDYTQHYLVCDLISAGMDPKVVDRLSEDGEIREKWALLEPYWELCRHTGYGRMMDLSVQTLYDVEAVNAQTIEEIERGYQALRAVPGYGERILRDVCHIEHVMDNIWHMNGDTVNGLYWFVTQVDNWMMLDANALGLRTSQDSMQSIEEWADLAIRTLKDDFTLRGAKGLKLASAYQRCLDFADVPRDRAQAAFAQRHNPEANLKDAQDYIMHAILRWADEERLLLQIHTGYQEGNGNLIANSNPEPLNPIIQRYKNIRFDLFHMGFPYQDFSCALGKMYPHVRLNLCWSHILSPMMARRALVEWIATVPLNKIFAFGGDCLFYDGVVGHLALAKQNVSEALGYLVEDGAISEKSALTAARRMFYENPKEFYGM